MISYKIFILFIMLLMHYIEDFHLQGCLANLKQKKWWIDELCKKFGKKYVDAAGSGRIAIGTPEGLLDYMRGVHHHHTQADVYIKEHATHTVGQPWAYDWIYITNGKVSYITTKYSYDEHAW